MRVTFLMAGYFDLTGGCRVIETHARHLLQRGHTVTVVTRPNAKASLKDQVRSLLKGNGLIRQRPGLSHFTNSPVTHRVIDRHRPIGAGDLPDADVVVATWWQTADWVAALPPEKGAKANFLQHYEAFEYLPKEQVDAVWRLDFHKITISRWLVDLASSFGDDDVTLVPNSVDLQQFNAPARGKQAIPSIGLLHHSSPWKGVETALAAVSRLLDHFPEVRLFTFGETPFDHPLPKGIDHQHWQKPAADGIRDIYAQCDVWLCASQSEGFHLPPLEAMACRCPVVSTRVGGPIDIVEQGVNGFLAPVGDVDALADHLFTVLSLPEDGWKRMSDAALATATGYSWEDASLLFEAGLVRAIEKSAARDR